MVVVVNQKKNKRSAGEEEKEYRQSSGAERIRRPVGDVLMTIAAIAIWEYK